MSDCEQCKDRPEAIITRKLKSMKITWVQGLGREHFFFVRILASMCTSVCKILAHTCREDHSIF